MPSFPAPSDAKIRRILTSVQTIALIGASAKPQRPSHEVMAYLQRRGYKVFPVNPGIAGSQLLGETVYARLEDVPRPIDMVDIFREPSALPAIVDSAIAVGAKVLWGQLGVVHAEAAATAQAAGLAVVMDRCPAIEIPRLGL